MLELLRETSLLFVLLGILAIVLLIIATKAIMELMLFKRYLRNRNNYLKKTFEITEDIL